MKVDVLLGLQWGDEGKGKIVDVLTPGYDVIARFQGGPNAGHSLEFNEIKHVLHSIPSGIFHPGKINLIGNGVVMDPVVFMEEVQAIEKLGVNVKDYLLISRKAHLILPTHRVLDAASEAAKGVSKIGSTLKGIGPTYMDKTGRNGIRVGDLERHDFIERYHFLRNKHEDILRQYDFSYSLKEAEEQWFKGIETVRRFTLVDSEYVINEFLGQGKKVLAEGAQGTMLDIDFGSYPFVTSSSTICAGACTGLGIAPHRVGEVFGIFKAYCTRVGSGPFPTELLDATGDELRKRGHEFGSTTGRPRRCGWLDLVALRYAIMLNGVTQLFMTKADVLSGFDTIRVCTAYKINGRLTNRVPYASETQIEPVYHDLPAWKENLCGVTSVEEFPKELTEYIAFLENELNLPISIVSVGPDRKQIIFRK
ncbi:MAG: adenylosuccinate synthase [Bacteroidales bacterium]